MRISIMVKIFMRLVIANNVNNFHQRSRFKRSSVWAASPLAT